MTVKQESRFSMHLVVRDHCLANAAITATLPNFSIPFTLVQSNIIQLQNFRELQEADKTGYAENKNNLKVNLVKLTADIARKMVAFASFTNNPVLLNEVNYTEPILTKKADTILRDCCQLINTRAAANAAALLTYGVTAANITAQLTAITAFAAAIPQPRLGIADKKKATDQIAVLLKTIDDNLEKMDIIVEVVKVSQPMFYKEYKNTRKIVETGIGTLSVQGKVTDKDSGESLQGATLKFTPDASNVMKKLQDADDNGDVVKRSKSKGGFNVKTLPEGSYAVRVSKPGYKDVNIILNVTDGALSTMKVKLVKKDE
jgi:hypothetical protein